jgi:hypothetical protein
VATDPLSDPFYSCNFIILYDKVYRERTTCLFLLQIQRSLKNNYIIAAGRGDIDRWLILSQQETNIAKLSKSTLPPPVKSLWDILRIAGDTLKYAVQVCRGRIVDTDIIVLSEVGLPYWRKYLRERTKVMSKKQRLFYILLLNNQLQLH